MICKEEILMKYDLSKHTSRSAQRFLNTSSATMLELLTKKDFDTITVSEICQLSNYPRATFYNYFEDKYNLVNYCWYSLLQKVNFDEVFACHSEKQLFNFFDRVYHFAIQNEDKINAILLRNDSKSNLVSGFVSYVKDYVQEKFRTNFTKSEIPIPLDLLSDFHSNTVLLILNWIFIEQHPTSLEQAHTYIRYFLNLD